MKSLVTAVFAVSLVGCAQDFVPKPNDLSVKDFTPGDDLTVAGEDGGGDMAVADLAMPDLAMPDLRPGADLTPVCNLSTGDASTVPALYLAGIVTGNSLSTTNFVESAGWSTEAVYGAHPVVDVSLGLYGGSPLLVARENDTANTLSYSTASGCSWGTLQAIYGGAATSNRPSLAGGDLIFRGKANNNLYHSVWDGSTWSSGTQLALLTDQWPSAVLQAGVVHAIHTGTTGGQLYDAPIGSAVITMTNALSNQGPTAVVTSDGTVYVVFTGTDTNLYWTKRASGAGSYAAPAQLCAGLGGTCLDTSDKQPLVALRSDGKPIAVWHGTNNKLYTSTLSDGTTPPWSAAIEATNGETTTYLPAIATGIGAASAELVYVNASGAARHTRLTGVWNTATTLGTQTYISTPALVSSN
jgi:hypothetical protein